MNLQNTRPGEKDMTVEEKLKALYELQSVVSEIDKIKTLCGELPLEVEDLEDELAGLETRITKYKDEVKNLDTIISNKKNAIKESQELIKKYTEQQNNVRNNREFDSLSKEIEFQTLEIELSEKKIKEFSADNKVKSQQIKDAKQRFDERSIDLKNKRKELNDISAETVVEEELLGKKADKIEEIIEERLLTAFKRIRSNARNGLALVTVQRDACGGCFNKIPPQRHLDISSRKKIIVCEYCGRILVDKDILTSLEDLVTLEE
ncbi:C4-type zinc ribbon domain-containing protein [Prolixibacteraceae bacterium]|nr:C4-type zinc ribbon domain-containing protein [Prolixibacteraceae bacterium]